MAPTRLERLKRELDSAVATGDFELALDVTTDMVELDPKSPIHHTSRGVVLAKLDRLDEALKELDRAIDIDPEDAKAWYSKGCILMDNGRPRPALACFYKSLDIDPTQSRARDRFLRCLDMMIEEKRESLEREKEQAVKEIIHEGPRLIREEDELTTLYPGRGREMSGEEAAPGTERTPLPDEEPELPTSRRKGGSLLDEDLFEDEEEEEGWEGEEEEEEEGEEDIGMWEEEEMEEEGWEEEDWEEEEEEEEEEEWDEDDEGSEYEEEEWEEEDSDEIVGTITCRCGESIPIYSMERPYRFRCQACGRTGTLK